MRDYSDGEVEASIARGTPFDKAGAYAIQDPTLRPVAAISGCYCNVMGLPLWDLWELFRAGETGHELRTPDQSRAVCGSCPRRTVIGGSRV